MKWSKCEYFWNTTFVLTLEFYDCIFIKRTQYILNAKIPFLFHILFELYFTFHFLPLYLHPLFISLSYSTPTNFIYLRIMVTTDWNYCTQLINSPRLHSHFYLLFFLSRFHYNYICRILSKSKFILKPSTLSDKSKK